MDIKFCLDSAKFKELSLNAMGHEKQDFFDNAGLSGQERLFFEAWSSQALQTSVFEPGKDLVKSGAVPLYAYVIITGEAKQGSDENGHEITYGPGSVLGLADGLAGTQSPCTITAVTAVNVKLIPIDVAISDISNLNSGLKGVCRFTLSRILGDRLLKEPDWTR